MRKAILIGASIAILLCTTSTRGWAGEAVDQARLDAAREMIEATGTLNKFQDIVNQSRGNPYYQPDYLRKILASDPKLVEMKTKNAASFDAISGLARMIEAEEIDKFMKSELLLIYKPVAEINAENLSTEEMKLATEFYRTGAGQTHDESTSNAAYKMEMLVRPLMKSFKLRSKERALEAKLHMETRLRAEIAKMITAQEAIN